MVTVRGKKNLDERLDISRDNELLQSFVRVNIEEEHSDHKDGRRFLEKRGAEPISKNESIEREKEEKAKEALQKQSSEQGSKPPSGRVRIVVKQPKRRAKRLYKEELYTDRDRAEAVNMGNKDIKQSLKQKRREDRKKNLHMAIDAEPTTFLALGNYEIRRGDLHMGLNFINKALELNPLDKNALVARSKCFILLGQPENALKDAEQALAEDKIFMKAIYQKAEALYYLGDFEHSLMFYHRGLKMRPDQENFKLGVNKAQKAIENAIGSTLLPRGKPDRQTPKSSVQNTARGKTPNDEGRDICKTPASQATAKTTMGRSSGSKKVEKKSRLLRQLAPDKDYLDNLLVNPNIRCKYKSNDDEIIGCIQEAVDFLNTRQEFWRQQLPNGGKL